MKPQILYLTLRLSSDYILLLIRPSISWIIPACPQIRPLDRTILPVLYRRSSSPLTILKILLITFPLALYTKHDPKDQCPKELPDDPVRTYKKNVCPIVASSSEMIWSVVVAVLSPGGNPNLCGPIPLPS